jgi:hydroxylamine reductase
MFCFQCQEALKNSGCIVKGICGKTADLANLQDTLIYTLKGIAFWGTRGRKMGVSDPATDRFVAEALFATISNVNFDPQRIAALIYRAIELRGALKQRAQAKCQELHGNPCPGSGPDWACWKPTGDGLDELIAKGLAVGIMADQNLNPDIRSLRELLVYGLKGLAAYTEHAYVLGQYNSELLEFLQTGLEATTNDQLGADDLVGLVLECGKMGVGAMALLDRANTTAYGNPEPTQVNLGVRPGPAILISGHDLLDLDELLQQTAGTGVNVYTHGEMLPANAYPSFKKYDHFVGNYGGAWWRQKEEFEAFGGAILMTTNCIITPAESYRARIFTTGLVGFPGVAHIADRAPGQQKDFSAVIAMAKQSPEPRTIEEGSIPVGFAHATVLSVADKVIAAVKSGAIQRFVVMAGCDGRQASRSYYTDLAQALPESTIILTAGCAKYRYNKLNLGTIAGIPRVLDAGQCNDSYSLVVIAQKLAEAFGLSDINDLPVSYDIAWYEQKAVIVLLALLYLGVKKIRLGPTLPAFLSPNVVDVLVKTFDIMPMGTVEGDLAAIMVGE